MTEAASQPAPSAVRPRPALFRALGKQEPPEKVTIMGRAYSRERVFKHDSWAATALYTDGRGRQVVCKFNRRQPIAGLPLRWLGSWLARREANALRRLGDLPNIPSWSGAVYVDGQRLDHAVAHEFIEGHPLGHGERVSDDFFPALRECLAEMHRRHMAYVDLHKRENILVGADGRPYLLDFQISLSLPHWWPANSTLTRLWLRLFQDSDNYHLHKHHVQCRSDQLGQGTATVSSRRPWWIRLHRLIAVPFRTLRRSLLVRLGIRNSKGRVDSEYFPEEVVRADRATQQAA
jgi:hypothetical protein